MHGMAGVAGSDTAVMKSGRVMLHPHKENQEHHNYRNNCGGFHEVVKSAR
jgi:hypothetical protein